MRFTSSIQAIESIDQPLRRHNLISIFWFIALTAVGGMDAYYTIFTGFQVYDDEGSLMTSVKQVLDGYRPYQDIVSGYGPIYYFYNLGVRLITNTPVTNDVTRLSSLLPWLVTTALCGWIVLRVTHSIVLASVLHWLVLQGLFFFRWEPGHPQELCMVLLVILFATALFWIPGGRNTYILILLGILTGSIALVKVNLGLFVFVGLGIALLPVSPPLSIGYLGRLCLSAISLILPPILMWSHFDDSQALVYSLVVTLSMGSGLYVSYHLGQDTLPNNLRDSGIAFNAFLVIIALTILSLAAWGVELATLFEALVIRHLGPNILQGTWYQPPRLQTHWAATTFIFTLVAGVCVHLRHHYKLLVVAILKLVVGIYGLLSADPTLNLVLLTPLCWLLLFPAREETEKRDSGWRTILCFITVLQTLYAYPIAGSQIHFIRIPLIIVAAILLNDAFAVLRHWEFFPRWRTKQATLATLLVLMLVFMAYTHSVFRKRATYWNLTPLALPGAELIRLSEAEAIRYQWLTKAIKTYCVVFLGFPHFPSLNFWSGVRAPGLLNLDAWIYLTTSEQEAIVTDLARFPNACVIYSPKWVAFWNKNNMDLSNLPLVRFIKKEFKIIQETDGFYFMVRKQRLLDRILTTD